MGRPSSGLAALFRFVQWELAGTLGPAPGRYVVRRYAGDDPRQVVLVAEGGLPAPPRRFRRRREPAPEVTRATVIDAARLGTDAAQAWLDRAGEGAVAEALGVLNRAVHAHALAAVDPYVGELAAGRALVTRAGYGADEEVADGSWSAVRVLEPAPRRGPRGRAVQERVAALLSGRDAALAAETLALRVRLDLDAGREREAALGLRVALTAALAELESWREEAALTARLAELRTREPAVGAAADAALEGGLDPGHREALDLCLDRLQAALRARTEAVRL